jgi:hypothetical protein
LDETLEQLGQADQVARRLETEGRRSPGACASHRLSDGQAQGDPARDARSRRADSPALARGGANAGSGRQRLSPTIERALRRLRS